MHADMLKGGLIDEKSCDRAQLSFCKQDQPVDTVDSFGDIF